MYLCTMRLTPFKVLGLLASSITASEDHSLITYFSIPALTASDRRKERKKNFVPANVGIISTVILFVYTTIQAFFIYQVTEALAV